MTATGDDDFSQKLEDLTSRVRAARTEAGLDPRPGPTRAAMNDRMGLGFRVAVELVVSTLVGGAIGYGLDAWLGIAPWGMVVCLGFGFAAGVMTIYRVVRGYDEAVGLGRAARDVSGPPDVPTGDEPPKASGT
jgi:ATP synthase protein I